MTANGSDKMENKARELAEKVVEKFCSKNAMNDFNEYCKQVESLLSAFEREIRDEETGLAKRIITAQVEKAKAAAYAEGHAEGVLSATLDFKGKVSAAYEEGRLWACSEAGMTVNWKHGFDKGQKEAYLDAAKIADDVARNIKTVASAEGDGYVDQADREAIETAKNISRLIRACAEEVK